MPYSFLGKTVSGRFTIPSGIITTQVSLIEKITHEIPEVGVITTKSIGVQPREGNREPIFAQYVPGCFINAVGLTNPGAEEFAKQLETIRIPSDRFLLISIFGKDADEFTQVAKIVAPYADGLELNLSCPHASGYGMELGQDSWLVYTLVRDVKNAVDIPVIPKLTPNVNNIAELAKAAFDGGADAICAINTVGPGYYTVDGYPVLTNAQGGVSGKGILPVGLNCVRKITETVDIPIIACGGISSAEDVRAYQYAGATIFGIGSALIGLSTEELKSYFQMLNQDLENGTNSAISLLKTSDMGFTKYRLVENQRMVDNLSLLVFDHDIRIQAGQFVFVWLPNVGEKPFSVLDHSPLTLAVQQRGCFTEKLCHLEPGNDVYIRGPYGVPVKIPEQANLILVSGGCGLAALYQIARETNNIEFFLGAKTKFHVFYVDKIRQFAAVNIATEDGSLGYQGMVTELLKQSLQKHQRNARLVFFNCGPEAMVKAAVKIEQQYTCSSKIYSAIDYITRCGVGICGSCASKDGRRLCVDGPFMSR